MVKDTKGELEVNAIGIPKFNDTSMEREFVDKINELLSIEVEIE